jgi:hypothetical protein
VSGNALHLRAMQGYFMPGIALRLGASQFNATFYRAPQRIT